MQSDKYRYTDDDPNDALDCNFIYEGVLYGNLAEMIHCGILGFCGCGNIREALISTRSLITSIKIGENLQDPHAELHYHLLDKLGLTTHGVGIKGSWLSALGEEVYKLLEEVFIAEGI